MLRDQVNSALKEGMKAKDSIKVSTLRMVNAAIKSEDIEARSKGNQDGIDDAAILSLLQKLIKQRRDSIEQYQQGGRPELADKEAAEITVIEAFLPKQLSDDELAKAIEQIKTDVGATTIKDMGKVMGELKSRYAGQIDMSKAGPAVKAALAA